MRSYVAADAVAENVFAEETFQHSQKTLAFSISDIVKGAVGVGFVRNRLLDGVSCRSCVAFHRDFLGDSGAASWIALNIPGQPNFPARIEMRGAFAPHPGSETFVQPKIVPPSHSDEIAEPLVRSFMRDDLINALARRRGRFLRIEKKRRFVVSDAAPIFHRAAETARNGDLIQLWKRIANAKVIIVILKDLRRALERVSARFRLAFGGNHPNLQWCRFALVALSRYLLLPGVGGVAFDNRVRARNFGFNLVEFASHKHVQVTGHRRRLLKANFFTSFWNINFAFRFDRHVRNRDPIFGNNCGQLKARPKTRLVPARKKPPCIARLELRAERYFFRTCALLLVRHVIKAAAFWSDRSAELEREAVLANRQLVRQRDGQQLVVWIELDRGW